MPTTNRRATDGTSLGASQCYSVLPFDWSEWDKKGSTSQENLSEADDYPADALLTTEERRRAEQEKPPALTPALINARKARKHLPLVLLHRRCEGAQILGAESLCRAVCLAFGMRWTSPRTVIIVVAIYCRWKCILRSCYYPIPM